MLIRFNVLLNNALSGQVSLLLSGLTMFIAGLGANFEFDLMKIIALSTLSQLGLMMSILLMGFYKLALFKALLFMCAGAIIQNLNNFRDIRLMGGLGVFMPLTSSYFNVANLALCDMPSLAGFSSKDMILEAVSLSYINMFPFFLFLFSTGLTVCYSLRLVLYSMTGEMNCSSLNALNDEGWLGLLVMSIVSGSMLSWLIFPTPVMICLPYCLKSLTLFVCIVVGLIGYLISNVSLFYTNKSLRNYIMSNYFGSMWFMPYISTYGVISYSLNLGGLVYKCFDQGWSEFMEDQNLYFNLTMISKLMLMLKVHYIMQNNNLKF